MYLSQLNSIIYLVLSYSELLIMQHHENQTHCRFIGLLLGIIGHECACVFSPVELSEPMDCSLPPGSSIHVILQVRIMEWVAISFQPLPHLRGSLIKYLSLSNVKTISGLHIF